MVESFLVLLSVIIAFALMLLAWKTGNLKRGHSIPEHGWMNKLAWRWYRWILRQQEVQQVKPDNTPPPASEPALDHNSQGLQAKLDTISHPPSEPALNRSPQMPQAKPDIAPLSSSEPTLDIRPHASDEVNQDAPEVLDVVQVRVRAKTDYAYRTVQVARKGWDVICDCDGFDGLICSHIDAVLIAGERGMVHPEDMAVADGAMALTRGKLRAPDYWKGSWRREMRWRGLAPGQRAPYVRKSSVPLVCFTGNCGRPRSALIAEAKSRGWDTINKPSKYLTVLVAADPMGTSAKLVVAREQAIPIVTPEEWTILISDGALPMN